MSGHESSITDHRSFLVLDDDRLLAQCDVDCYRASGPGGQKRNKTSSAVRLRHNPTGLIVVAVESRSQHENRAKALQRLRWAIALQCRRPGIAGSDRGNTESHAEVTGPRAVSQHSAAVTPLTVDNFSLAADLQACVGRDGHVHVARKDPLRTRLAAELLDLLTAAKGQLRTAAQHVGLSTSGLVDFLKSDRHLFAAANDIRRAHNQSPIR